MGAPLVSAIIPTQNRPDMLREAAASVLAQTYSNIELIIVLNAASHEAIDAAAEIASAPNVHLISLPHGGLSAARNEGIRRARGEWVAFLDDDDLWMPTKIEEQLREACISGADLIGCDMMLFDDRGEYGLIGSPLPARLGLKEALTVYNCLPGSASGALIRARAILSLN